MEQGCNFAALDIDNLIASLTEPLYLQGKAGRVWPLRKIKELGTLFFFHLQVIAPDPKVTVLVYAQCVLVPASDLDHVRPLGQSELLKPLVFVAPSATYEASLLSGAIGPPMPSLLRADGDPNIL